MAKKRKKKHRDPSPAGASTAPARAAAPADDGISKRGWLTIGGGVLLLAAGFFVLTLADPMGRNWAAHLSPFLILGGYAVIGLGIVLPEAPEKPGRDSGPPASA